MTEQTSRLSIVIDTGNAEQRLRALRQSLQQLQTGTAGTASGLQSLTGQTQNLGNTATRTTAGLTSTNSQLLTMARNANNANNASRGVNGLVNPLARVNELLSRTQAIISGGLFGLMALSVAKTADEMQSLNSQIMQVTANEQEQAVVKERLHQMANKNLTDIKSTIGLYTNSARALGNMGKSQAITATL
ncbi:hypothetical protein ACGTJS_03135 [Faucicola mancuniensis]|uniref:hypothetical protein n=1 Tax=Faucicola mancuniensis TaxID=1309795 RepID=UPI0039775819